MNEQKDEKWLDELISKAIDTSEPKFDAENWKQKHPREFQSLVKGPSRWSSQSRFAVFSIVLKSRAVKVAAAAVIIVAISFFIAYPGPDEQGQAAKSPAEMVTAMSLRMAYRQGGMEALEKQCDEAVKLLGPSRPGSSLADLYRDLNG